MNTDKSGFPVVPGEGGVLDVKHAANEFNINSSDQYRKGLFFFPRRADI